MKVVMLLSGGVDSTVLAYYLNEKNYEVVALTFDYGQRHRKEIEYAKRIAEKLGFEHEVIKLPDNVLGKTALIDIDELPKDVSPFDSIQKITVVPNRNMILLSVAVGYALSRDIETVFIATHKDDWTIYPDCRPEFFRALNDAIRFGNEVHDDVVQTPFLYKYKWEIVKLGDQLGVDWKETWTCYEGGEEPCGRCASCLERKEAFEIAGVIDGDENGMGKEGV